MTRNFKLFPFRPYLRSSLMPFFELTRPVLLPRQKYLSKIFAALCTKIRPARVVDNNIQHTRVRSVVSDNNMIYCILVKLKIGIKIGQFFDRVDPFFTEKIIITCESGHLFQADDFKSQKFKALTQRHVFKNVKITYFHLYYC